MYVCMYVPCLLAFPIEQLGSHRKDFHKILYLRIFRKPVTKIQLSLHSDRNNWYCTWRPMNIYFTDFLEWEIFEISREKQNTHLMFKSVFWKLRRLSDNVGNYGRARQATDDNKWDAEKMRFTCRESKGRIQTALITFNTYCFITD
jgi:hypothetical protein